MFRKMEYVLEIYKQKSFTKAAEKLYISQPCLSAAVKEIEKEIGAPLFERRYSGLKLTETGREYIKTAEELCVIRERFVSKIKSAENLESGKLNIGGSNYITSYVLPQIINIFSCKYPKIEIILTEGNSIELENKLQSEEIDVLIDSYEPKITQKSYPLLSEKIMIAVPKVFEINKKLEKYHIHPSDINVSESVESISIKNFEKEKFVLLKNGHDMHSKAVEVFKNGGISPSVSFYLDQLSTSYNFASSGNGVCFITDTMFKFHQFSDDVILYNINECTTRPLFIGKKKNRYTSPAMDKFIEIACKVIK